MTGAQNEFLDRTIKGLSQEGRVVSVRLALFAEMLKGKPWTPETLKQVGGAEGVGVTFLEETFSARTAPPSYRIHQKAAQAVLKALLPETGTNIKGNMRSYDELLEVSGYGSRPNDFDELIRILDSELRLISPTEPEGSESEGQTKTQAGEKFFLLTHDYLVPSIREWLTRKQRETRQGRAELRLVGTVVALERQAREPPSAVALEWANIRLLTRKKDWTEPQRKMMKRAGRVHGLRGLGLAALLALVSLGRRLRAMAACGLRLWWSRSSEWTRPTFPPSSSNSRATAAGLIPSWCVWSKEPTLEAGNISMPALPSSPSMPPRLITSSTVFLLPIPDELPVLRDALKPHRATLTPKLWTVLESAKPGDASLLPAASALASYDPG